MLPILPPQNSYLIKTFLSQHHSQARSYRMFPTGPCGCRISRSFFNPFFFVVIMPSAPRGTFFRLTSQAEFFLHVTVNEIANGRYTSGHFCADDFFFLHQRRAHYSSANPKPLIFSPLNIFDQVRLLTYGTPDIISPPTITSPAPSRPS